MDHAWVDAKNNEVKNKYERQKKETFDKLVSSEYLTGKDRERALSKFEKGDFYGIDLITDTLYLDFEDDEGNLTEKSMECKKWHDSLNLGSLDNYTENPYDRYLDSEPMEFDGDIIITDPCYICKEKEEIGTYPNPKDFMSYENVKDYPDSAILTDDKLLEPSDSDDDAAAIKKLMIKLGIGSRYVSEQYNAEQVNYKQALEKYREDNLSDWALCNCGFEMEKLGIHHYMTRDTLYGDWSCTTFDCDTKKEIGKFCADAGLVSVILLEDVLKYNPGFDNHLNKVWTTTWIKDFKGTVQFIVKRDSGVYDDDSVYHKKGDKWEDYSVEVVGTGINKKTNEPIHFLGMQIGF